MGVAISIGIFASVIIVFSIVVNNQISTMKKMIVQSYENIEIYLKKRFDLMPSLIMLLKKYMVHEKEVLSRISKLKREFENTNKLDEKIKASNEFSNLLTQLHINTNDYPNLKTDTQFINLQHKLADLENFIATTRRTYNASVKRYNIKIQKFPASIIANIRKDKIEPLLTHIKLKQKALNIYPVSYTHLTLPTKPSV